MSRRAALAPLAAGLVLAAAGAWHLDHEWTRQRILRPLARSAARQQALAAAGAAVLAEQVERAARKVGDAPALMQGADILADLSLSATETDLARDLRRRTLALAQAALRRSPGGARAHLLAAAVLTDLGGHPVRADWHLSRAAALDPFRGSLQRRIGLIELARGQDSRAADHLRAALRAAPGEAPELYDALDLASTSLTPRDVTPPTPRAQVALGSWLDRGGDQPGARHALETALSLADRSAGTADGRRVAFWAYRVLESNHFRHARFQAARDLAAARLAAGRFTGAAEEALLAYHQGTALVRMKKHEAALPWLEKAAHLEPSVVSLDALARCQVTLARHREAAESWRRALLLPRRSPGEMQREVPMRLGRAASLAHTGSRPEALRELQRVLARDPVNRRARKLAREIPYE
ncbi:MAG: hypothetical protein ACE5HD_12975 [Acidobacteriota bacterium]